MWKPLGKRHRSNGARIVAPEAFKSVRDDDLIPLGRFSTLGHSRRG